MEMLRATEIVMVVILVMSGESDGYGDSDG